MNKDVKITTRQLRQAVHGDMQKLLDKVTGAVNTAPDWCGASESGAEPPHSKVLIPLSLPFPHPCFPW